jgi:hypothetical protein
MQGSDGRTTGSPSPAISAAAVELLRVALAGLDGGVVRLGDLRETLERELTLLADDERTPRPVAYRGRRTGQAAEEAGVFLAISLTGGRSGW